MRRLVALLLGTWITLGVCVESSLASDRPGEPEPEYISEDANFLNEVGIAVSVERRVEPDGRAYLLLTFTSRQFHGYADTIIDLIYADTADNILLGIYEPFPNSSLSVQYTIPAGFKLVVVVARGLNDKTKYYKVVFE